MLKAEQIEIPLSKLKLLLMLAGSIAFVAAGIWFVTKPTAISTRSFHNSPVLIVIVGAASILFFGVCAIFIVKKIIDNTPGLVINDEGINDNSSGTSAGLILWKDIKKIEKTTVLNQSFIAIIVDNPEEYIDRQKSFIKRKTMELNFKNSQSPINISANGLKCNFNELYNIVIDAFDANKSKAYIK